MAGRPSTKFEVNLNHIDESLEKIKSFSSHSSTKESLKLFSTKLFNLCNTFESKETQTVDVSEDNVLDDVLSLTDDGMCFILRNIWENLQSEDKRSFLLDFYLSQSEQDQCMFLASVGNFLNESVLTSSTKIQEQTRQLTFRDLCNISKQRLIDSCDVRIKSFLTSLTEKKNANNQKYHHDNSNEIANLVDNIYKARNSKFVSPTGARESLIVYLSSSKSVDSTHVISKQGGKCTRTVLDNIIRNSVEKNKFSPPKNVTTFYSFDNIQQMFGSQRITGKDQVLAMVVTSILCTLPDGYKQDNIQYKAHLSPSSWFSNYQYNDKTSIDKLDKDCLLECALQSDDDEKVVDSYFNKDLEQAIESVSNSLDKTTLKDDIDLVIKENVRKIRKLCMNNHIVETKSSKRKYCDRPQCKALLKDNTCANELPNVDDQTTFNHNDDNILSEAEKRSKHYMNVTNIDSGFKPVEVTVGAYECNPNTSDRIAKVLKKITEKAHIEKPSVLVTLKDNEIQQEIIGDDSSRSFVVVSADGLPFKQMIRIVREYHTCKTCGIELKFITELKTHKSEKGHNTFFQTFGNILIQSGHFHYMMCMVRSFVKLSWDLDIEELSASIGLDTIKAKFMVSKVTNIRKVTDVLRSIRIAKLRELVLPYVKFALQHKFQPNIEDFFKWKEVYVKSKTYNTVYELERVFGTSLLLYISAMRSNNNKILTSAKRVFSPLLHVNNNPNYSIIDIYTDYQDAKLKCYAPSLSKYMETRRFTNKTGNPYCYSPHDERHEEYNKRGMNFQKVRTLNSFKENFAVCDDYSKMRDNCLENDYKLKNQENTISKVPNYDQNVQQMRVLMRTKRYLSNPLKESELLTLSETPVNESLSNITNIAKEQRRENVMKIIKTNDFFCGFKTKKFDIFGSNTAKIDYRDQVKIFIGSIESTEQKLSLYEYWQVAQNHSNYSDKQFMDNLLENRFDYI